MTEFAADAFTDTEDTSLSAHTPTDARGWTWTHEFFGGAGDIRCKSNRARPWAGAVHSRYRATATPGDADQTVTANWTRLGTATDIYLAVSLRAGSGTDATDPDMYKFGWTGFEAGGVWFIQKMVAGVETTLGTFDGDETDATTYSFEARAIGSSLKLYTSGIERISVTDTAVTQVGSIGLRKFDDGTGSGGWGIDDLVASDSIGTGVSIPIRSQHLDYDYSR